jgi:hypothetical protein
LDAGESLGAGVGESLGPGETDGSGEGEGSGEGLGETVGVADGAPADEARSRGAAFAMVPAITTAANVLRISLTNFMTQLSAVRLEILTWRLGGRLCS